MHDVRQHARDAFGEIDLWLPAENFADLADVGERAVRFARSFGDVNDVAAQQFNKTIDGLRVSRADVEPLTGYVGLSGSKKRRRNIGGVDEVPALASPADAPHPFSL